MQKSGLSAIQLTMLCLGTVIGASFFLGSAIAIKAAGPSIIIGFILGGALVYIILNALSEMTVADPCIGSFRTHAARTYGPFIGFLVGWVYWTGLILAMSSEATAAAILIKSWFPYLSLPLLSITIVITVTLINLLGAGLVTRLESTLAAVKILAIVLFIVIAVVLIFGLLPNRDPVGLGAIQTVVFFPNGIGGLAGSMLLVILGYAGFEIIGLAASETRDPHKNIPRAINASVISLLSFYIIIIALLLPLIHTETLSTETSPMVSALFTHGFGVAAGVVNFVLITAILSAMLASVFGLGRMLRSLADNGDAPAFLKEKSDFPVRGILFSGIVTLLGVSMSFFVPERVYIFLISSGGFSLLLTYLVIMITHIRFRNKFGCPPKGNCQLKGYPYTTWAAIVSLIIIIVTMPLIPGQGSGLLAGLLLVGIYSAGYFIFRRIPLQRTVAAKPLRDNKNENNKNK